MQSQEPTAAAAQSASNEAVFSTAHLVWLDLESGDELSIELFGPRPFLDDLIAQGFLLQDCRPAARRPDEDDAGSKTAALDETQFRIHARIGRN